MKQDLLAKRYYSDNRRFADLINGIVCNGIPIVKQEDLSEMDTENGQGKRRDLVRKAVLIIMVRQSRQSGVARATCPD